MIFLKKTYPFINYFGYGAFFDKMLLVRNVENNKIYDYFKAG